MECSCGGTTKEARAERTRAGIVLEYQVCIACGRNEYGALLLRNRAIASGIEAQRLFVAMDDGAPPVEPATAPSEPSSWTPSASQPTGAGLIRVRFAKGGHFIERPSFFAHRWDLIDAWQPYDNGPALASAQNPPPIPPELRVGTPLPEPKRAARKMPPPPPLESVPRGVTLSLF